MNIENLKEGQIFKNYRELCLRFDEKVKSGKSKQLQLKNWGRYFNWSKKGNKFIITEIFDTPKEKIDNRKDNGRNPNSRNAFKERYQWDVPIENINSIGVYKIILENNIYIGSTIVGFRTRFMQHLRPDNPLGTKELLENGAKFSIVQEMNGCTEEEIREMEEYVINLYKLGDDDWKCINKLDSTYNLSLF